MTDQRAVLSRGANDNVIVTDVKGRGARMMSMIHIYDQSEMQTGVRQARKINWSRIIHQRGGTIFAGDFNAHSRRWDPTCKERRDETFCEEIIDEYGLEIGNDDQPTHHRARNGEKSESTIDLTLASRPITRRTILGGRHAKASHRKVIEWESSVNRQEEADHAQVIGWN